MNQQELFNNATDEPEIAEDLSISFDSNILHSDVEEKKLRRQLKFFFMNPIEKYQNKQRFPYKFIVQLIKIIVVTLQLSLFARHRTNYIDYAFNSQIAFSHLFIEDWDPSREIPSYPPPVGELAIYKTSEFFAAVDFAVKNYANLDKAIGLYSYINNDNSMAPVQLCFQNFKKCDIFPYNESYFVDTHLVETCININITKKKADNFSIENFFLEKKIDFNFASLVDAKLIFKIKTINLKSAGPTALPACFIFNVSLNFDNSRHEGRLIMSMNVNYFRLQCKGSINYIRDSSLEFFVHSFINSVVMLFSLLSLILCGRSLYRAQILKRKTISFFKTYLNKNVSFKGKLKFLNLWYVTIILSDVLVICGSALKEKIENNEFWGDEWNICSVILGTATFLMYFCILRYLSFFKTYNVIILTLKFAFPALFRFMICVFFIYTGFTFCGWLVLGPYHLKFRTLSGTSECLFALLNGDDVFATFTTLEPTKSNLVWWFSRIYLYFFISLFIYVVLSLFVSVILDAYEGIKTGSRENNCETEIEEFIDGPIEKHIWSDSSSSLADDILGYCQSFSSKICCCKKPNVLKREKLNVN